MENILGEKYMSNLKKEYLVKYGSGDIFIETGTYFGDTVQLALDSNFKMVHSIEIDQSMYNTCATRFANDDRVKLWLGDSVDIIPRIVDNLTSPATFWLDAHASGPLQGGRYAPCPLILELESIFAKKKVKFTDKGSETFLEKSSISNHTIFIDDRRLFGSAEWGYVQEKDVMNIILAINPNYKIHYLDGHQTQDIICATMRD